MINDNPWKKISYSFNSAVGLDGFEYLINIYNIKYKHYLTLINDYPNSEEESTIKNFELNDPYFEISLYRNLLQIIACTTIETLINSAGINIFSEKYYKKTLERNNIVIKVKLLIAVLTKEEIEDNNEIIMIIKRLFEKRNLLVHPKSKKITENNLHEIVIDHYDVSDFEVIELKENLYKVISFFQQYKLVSPDFLELQEYGIVVNSNKDE